MISARVFEYTHQKRALSYSAPVMSDSFQIFSSSTNLYNCFDNANSIDQKIRKLQGGKSGQGRKRVFILAFELV